MHLLLRDGALLPSPVPVTLDAEGAAMLAALYAPTPPPGGVHVRAMMNTTIDGAIAGPDGTSGPLRNPEDSFVFDVLRALCDVVLVGAETVRREDYTEVLGRTDLLEPSRRPGGASRPALAIWSRSGEVPDTVQAAQPTFLLTPSVAREEATRRSGLPAAQVLAADTPAKGIAALAAQGVRAIQAEGGPSALGRLVTADLLDELCFSVTHRTVGGDSPRVVMGEGHDQAWRLTSMLIGEHATITRYQRA